MDASIKKNKLQDFTDQLESVKAAFEKVIGSFGIQNNITLKVVNGKVVAVIDVEELRRG